MCGDEGTECTAFLVSAAAQPCKLVGLRRHSPCAPTNTPQERFQRLTAQLTTWHQRTPKLRPNFNALLDSGQFVPLTEIISKTVPFIDSVLADFTQTPASALRVRDAVRARCSSPAPAALAQLPRVRARLRPLKHGRTPLWQVVLSSVAGDGMPNIRCALCSAVGPAMCSGFAL